MDEDEKKQSGIDRRDEIEKHKKEEQKKRKVDELNRKLTDLKNGLILNSTRIETAKGVIRVLETDARKEGYSNEKAEHDLELLQRELARRKTAVKMTEQKIHGIELRGGGGKEEKKRELENKKQELNKLEDEESNIEHEIVRTENELKNAER